jgi:hypothetical protein
MVKISIKNITNCLDYDFNTAKIETDPLIISISEKTKTDTSFNKFLGLGLKYNILIFEKTNNDLWNIKNKNNILNQIDKLIRTTYNDHIINITQISIESINNNFTDIKTILDKLHIGLKKKLLDLYDFKYLLENIELNLFKNEEKKIIRKKKIISNDIYIEEFSN